MMTVGLDLPILEHLWLDHLWQSTLFALGVGLLILAFRRAPAGVRYGLWLAASAKFLIPFAPLAALGRVLLERLPAATGQVPTGVVLIEQATKPLSRFPFAQPEAALMNMPASALPAPEAAPHVDLALMLLALWVLGCAVVLARWIWRSAQVRAAVRSARPLPWPATMPVLAAPWLLEPGLVGLWRPVLVVPETLPERLGLAEIEALVAHETCHLRRRDNLTAALHMLVEALVWFHPLVWWIGARLIEERERACDEAVVRTGCDRTAYAHSLVEICRFYLQSPLPCVAGASGSNLKDRVEAIMTAPLSSPLSRSKKALLLAAGVCAFATPVAAGLLTTPAGHEVVAKAEALASSGPLRALAHSVSPVASEPSENGAPKPIALARNEAVLGPGVAVVATDAKPLPLTQDVAAPRMQDAPPIQLASVDAAPRTPNSVQAAEPADLSKQASDFVKSYAEVGLFDWVIRLDGPLCVQVLGLPPEQATAVKARIEAVAQALSLKLFSTFQTCGGFKNVRVLFTTDPQHELDNMIVNPGQLVGDDFSDTRNVKTVTRPIQAWYRTICYVGPCASDPVAKPPETVTVLVDARRTQGVKLGTMADYAAMLALSEPRSPDRCQVLPSVLDLFAGACAGRPAPTGLTPSDLAYLKAVYTAGRRITEPEWSRAGGGGTVDQVAGRMGMLLAGHGSFPSPGAAPERAR